MRSAGRRRVRLVMSMYIPPDDQHPTDAEAVEYLDDPREGEVPEIRHRTRLAQQSVQEMRDDADDGEAHDTDAHTGDPDNRR